MVIKFNQLNTALQQDFTIENSKQITKAILDILGIKNPEFTIYDYLSI